MTTEEIATKSVFEAIRQKLVVDGWLPDIIPLDMDNPLDTPEQTEAKYEQFQQQLLTIKQTKGYAIELFNFSNNQAKGNKKVARIVIDEMSLSPGTIGTDPAVRYEQQGEYFVKKQDDNLLTDMIFCVYAVGNTSIQMFEMNNIIMSVLPKMGYIKYYDESLPRTYGNLFVRLRDKGKTDDLEEGVMERYFVYEMKDLQEIDPITVPGQITPINDINLEIQVEE